MLVAFLQRAASPAQDFLQNRISFERSDSRPGSQLVHVGVDPVQHAVGALHTLHLVNTAALLPGAVSIAPTLSKPLGTAGALRCSVTSTTHTCNIIVLFSKSYHFQFFCNTRNLSLDLQQLLFSREDDRGQRGDGGQLLLLPALCRDGLLLPDGEEVGQQPGQRERVVGQGGGVGQAQQAQHGQGSPHLVEREENWAEREKKSWDSWGN